MRVAIVGGSKSNVNYALAGEVENAGHEASIMDGREGHYCDAMVYSITPAAAGNDVISAAITCLKRYKEKFILNVMTYDGEKKYVKDEYKNLLELGKMVQDAGAVFASGFEPVLGALHIRQHHVDHPVPEPVDSAFEGLQEERHELTQKIDSLGSTLYAGNTIIIPWEQCHLMHKQLDAMIAYRDILNERVRIWKR